MSALVRVLQRTITPIKTISSVRGMVTVALAVIVAPAGFVGYFAGAAIGVIVALAVVLVLVLIAAIQTQRELDERDVAPRPYLELRRATGS